MIDGNTCAINAHLAEVEAHERRTATADGYCSHCDAWRTVRLLDEYGDDVPFECSECDTPLIEQE